MAELQTRVRWMSVTSSRLRLMADHEDSDDVERGHAEAAPRSAAVVLVVDDDADVRALVRVSLRFDDRFGEVLEAPDAETAIAQATARPDIAAVVLDEFLAGASGLAILPMLRARLGAARIVLFTADEASRDVAVSLGADGARLKTEPMARLRDDLLS